MFFQPRLSIDLTNPRFKDKGTLIRIQASMGRWGSFNQPEEELEELIHPIQGRDREILFVNDGDSTGENRYWECATVDLINKNNYNYINGRPSIGFQTRMKADISFDMFIRMFLAHEPLSLPCSPQSLLNSFNFDPEEVPPAEIPFVRFAPLGVKPVTDGQGNVKNPVHLGKILKFEFGFPSFGWTKDVSGADEAWADEGVTEDDNFAYLTYEHQITPEDLTFEYDLVNEQYISNYITISFGNMTNRSKSNITLKSELHRGVDPHWVEGTQDYRLRNLQFNLIGATFTVEIKPLRVIGDQPDEDGDPEAPDPGPEPGPNDPGGENNPWEDFDINFGDDPEDEQVEIEIEIDTVDENGDPITIPLPRTNDTISIRSLLNGTPFKLPCQGSEVNGEIINYAGATFRITLTITEIEFRETTWLADPTVDSTSVPISPPIEVTIEGQFPDVFNSHTHNQIITEVFEPPIFVATFGGTIPEESETQSINLPPGFSFNGNDLVLNELSINVEICEADIPLENGFDETFNLETNDPTITNPGFNESIWDIATRTGSMIVAGNFTSFNNTSRNRILELNNNGTENTSFYDNLGGLGNLVRSISIQTDGKIILGGSFTSPRSRVVRYNSDGTLDTGFDDTDSQPNNDVHTTAIMSDGTILIGGRFTGVTSAAPIPVGILALNNNGTLNTTLNSNFNGGLTATIPTDRFQIPGWGWGGASDFRYFQPNDIGSTFANTAGSVFDIKVQADDKILIGGLFEEFATVSAWSFVRLNDNGSLDTSFNTNLPDLIYIHPEDKADRGTIVRAITIDSEDSIIIGGSVTSRIPEYEPGSWYSMLKWGHTAFLMRLNSDGSEDTDFTEQMGGGFANSLFPLVGQGSWATPSYWRGFGFASYKSNSAILTLKTYGSVVLVGGDFELSECTEISVEVKRHYFAILTPEGRDITSRYYGGLLQNSDEAIKFLNGAVRAIGITSNNEIVLGGDFTRSPSYEKRAITRLDINSGNLDTTWYSSVGIAEEKLKFGSTVPSVAGAIAKTSDNSEIFFGGTLFRPGGETSRPVRRIFQEDGRSNLNFIPNIDLYSIPQSMINQGSFLGVQTLLVDSDFVYLGGTFGRINNTMRSRIARIHLESNILDSWNPNISGTVVNTILKEGNSLYLGGSFYSPSRNITKVDDIDGTVDSAWDLFVNNSVRALAIDGSNLYVGGDFTAANAIAANGFAQVDATSAEPSNSGNFDFGADNRVRAFLIDGNDLYLGGDFLSIQGESRRRIAKLDLTDGSVDSWDPDINSGNRVNTIIKIDSDVYFGGFFWSVSSNSRGHAAKVDAQFGILDSDWRPNPNSEVNVLLAAKGDILIGGVFTSIRANQAGSTITRRRLARIDTTDGIATSWNPAGTSYPTSVETLWLDGDELYVGGNFTAFNGQSRSRIAKFDISGTETLLDWNPGTSVINSTVLSLFEYDGFLYAGGSFTSAPGRVTRLDKTDATRDTTWNPSGINSNVHTIYVDSSGVYIGGLFTHIESSPQNYIAKLSLTDGSLEAWNPRVNDRIDMIQKSGTDVYFAGRFTEVREVQKIGILKAALSDGELDEDFTANATDTNNSLNLPVWTLAVSGNYLYAGGEFLRINGSTQRYLARIDKEIGTLDTSWSPTFSSSGFVRDLIIDGDDLYFCGDFTTVNSQPRRRIAKYSTTSNTLDTTFIPPRMVSHYHRGHPHFGNPVNAFYRKLEIDGDDLYVVGNQTEVFGRNLGRIFKLTGGHFA